MATIGRRLEQHGPNQLQDSGRRPLWHLILKQFSDFMILVLLAEVKELRLQGAWGADALKAIIDPITRTVAVLVIFTNTINILGPILAGRKAMQLYGDSGIAIITALLTLGTIVFSEIIPKSLGIHYAPFISRVAAPAIRLLTIVLYPLVVSLEWLSDLLKSGERRIGTEAQIRFLTTMGRRAGHIESDEGQLIRRAFLLNDRLARDRVCPKKLFLDYTACYVLD